MEITLELSCCKHPPADKLARFWMDNKNALMSFMELAHMGVKGTVTDANGNYIKSSSIRFNRAFNSQFKLREVDWPPCIKNFLRLIIVLLNQGTPCPAPW